MVNGEAVFEDTGLLKIPSTLKLKTLSERAELLEENLDINIQFTKA